MPDTPLILNTDRGLFCPAGDFYIDAWRPVPRTIVTHAHSDHARRGSSRYLTTSDGLHVLRKRMGDDATIDTIPYGQSIDMNGVRVSLHPAGHLLGSAQVRIEHAGQIWLITGDYKRQPDPTCRPFELIQCHTLVTECTFGLPIFRWRDPQLVTQDINDWWRNNITHGRTSMLLAYSLGKAQRILASIDPSIGPILLHGATFAMTEAYQQSGVSLPPTQHATAENAKAHRGKALVICPPSAAGSTWARKFSPTSLAIASGWMQVRGFRRRGGIDRGFVLSDHVDWPDLMQTINESGANHIIATHGYTQQLSRYLTEQGRSVSIFQTRFTNVGEEDESTEETNQPPIETNDQT
jgi:putative mRNA 3-end processing factor